MGSHILALDVGTSSVHAVVTDSFATPIASASAPVHYHTPEGLSALAKEFDPQSLLESLREVVREALKEAGITGPNISVISVTSQRQGVVFLDSGGDPLYCGPNIDLRAVFQGSAMDEDQSEEIYASTGHLPSMLFAPARLRWFLEVYSERYSQIEIVLTIAGWLAFKLTGNLAAERSLDVEAGLADVISRDRNPELMERLGVTPSLLPPFSNGLEPTGSLTNELAGSWGLRAGVPVVLAGPDTQCGLLGLGLKEEGDTGLVIGWSGALQVLTSRPSFDDQMRTWVGLFPDDGLWVAESNLGDVGNSYRWLKDVVLGSDESFKEVDDLVCHDTASPDGVVSFLGPGPTSSPKAGLRMGGILFPTPVSFQETSRGQLFRAAFENIAYSVKANLATLRDVTGLDTRELYLGGGIARSRVLAPILANVLGLPIRRSLVPDVSGRGAAMRATSIVNGPAAFERACELAARQCERVDPSSPVDVATYQGSFERWLEQYSRLGWDS